MSNDKKTAAEVILLPEARVINSSPFVLDTYRDPKTGKDGKPSYKFELAFVPATVTGEGTFEDKLVEAVTKEWPADVEDYLDFIEGKPTKHRWNGTFKKGDELAAARADKGKEGDAYKGTLVLRVNTDFNRDGVRGPGGMAVYAPDTSPIGIVEGNQAEVYNGCYGRVAVTLAPYEINGNRYVTVYLKAFQKTRDGTPLKAAASNPFAAVGTPAAANTAGVRQRRAG